MTKQGHREGYILIAEDMVVRRQIATRGHTDELETEYILIKGDGPIDVGYGETVMVATLDGHGLSLRGVDGNELTRLVGTP